MSVRIVFLLCVFYVSLFGVNASEIEFCKNTIDKEYAFVCIAKKLFIERLVKKVGGNGISSSGVGVGYGIVSIDMSCQCKGQEIDIILETQNTKK